MVTLIAPRKIVATATASATLARGAHTPVDATSGAKTMTLPANAPAGVEISVEKVDSSTNVVTVSGTIRGASGSIPLTSQYESRTFLSDGAGSWTPISDHRTAASLATTFAAKPVSAANVAFPLWIAHRGAASLHPENTIEAFEAAAEMGCQAVEGGDIQTLADGMSLACMHDTTVDRTTTSSGNVSDLTPSAFQQLTLDAGVWLGGGWSNTLKAPLFSQIMARLGGRVLLTPESKDGHSAANMAKRIRDAGLADSYVITSFGFTDCQDAIAGGVRAMYVDTTGATKTPAEIVAAGIKWVCVDYSAVTAATVTALKAAGIRVLCYTPGRKIDVAAAAAKGITDGGYSDEPLYLAGTAHRRTLDPWKAQTWYHGHIGMNNDQASRGVFTAPKYWGYTDSTSAFFIGALQGWACPVANAASTYTFTFSMILDALAGGDTTRWGAVWFGAPDDRAYNNSGVSTENGYLCLFRANGNIDLYKVAAGAATLIASKTTGVTPLTLGTPAKYKITVTPTTVMAERVDVAYATPVATDSAFRGGYIHMGRNGASVRFSDASIG